ncbi:MAG: DUF47 domain-containing protein, partial [Bdellovibrionota bacterium]
MLGSLMPKEGKFFELFHQASDLLVEGAVAFKELVSDMAHVEAHARKIKNIEHQADEVTHRTMELL